MDGTKTTRVESKSFYIFLASASLLQIRCRLRFGRVVGCFGCVGCSAVPLAITVMHVAKCDPGMFM